MKEFILSNEVCNALNIRQSADISNVPHGTLILANASLFSQATYQTEVTSGAIGYSDPYRNRLIEFLNFLAPKRPGPRNAMITVYDEDEPFEAVSPEKVKREMTGDFHTVKQRTSSKVARALVNRGLSVVLDKDQLKDKPDWQQLHANWMIDMLTRASLLELVELYLSFAPSAPVVWDALANPDLDIKSTNIQVLAAVSGFNANRAAYGEVATLIRQLAYESMQTAGGFARAALMSDEQIAGGVGVERVMTNVERYNNGGTKTQFLGSRVLLFSGQDQESPADNSNVVRHVSNTDMGGEYAVYIDEKLKKVIITVENYELFATQHTSGCGVLEVTGV